MPSTAKGLKTHQVGQVVYVRLGGGEVGVVEKMKEGWWRGRGTGERWGKKRE